MDHKKQSRRHFIKKSSSIAAFLTLPVSLPVGNLGFSGGRTLVVAQENPFASDKNPGTAKKPFRTISKAAALAEPGDRVLVHKGIYREWVAPARGGKEGKPVTYLAGPGEEVVVRGSEIYDGEWSPVDGREGVFYTKIPENFFRAGFNPFKIIFPEYRGGGRQGQIFIDGEEIMEAREQVLSESEATENVVEKSRMESMFEQEGSWSTVDGEKIYLHLPKGVKSPEQVTVEISVQRHLFAPDRRAQNYINLKGFTFEHCANDVSFPQVGAVSCRSGQHWIIEDNRVRKVKTIGVDFGAEDENPWLLPDILPEDRFLVSGHHDMFKLSERRIPGRHLILNNTISDCGQCGLAGLFSDGTIVKGNVVERCGRVVPGFETGGIKIHGLMGGTVEGNLVRDNESWGIWLDCGYIGSRVTRNVVVNNKISGIFFECCNGPGWIDNNVIAYNRGDGIYAHDASGIHVANNLIFGNTNFGVYMCVATDRLVPPYHYATGLYEDEISSCSWERIFNNMVVQNKEGAISLPHPSERAQDNLSDYNLFARAEKGPRFVVHFRNGEKKNTEQAVDEARKAFQQSGDAGLSGEDLVMWKKGKGLAMNLSQWQKATGNDQKSLVGEASASLDLSTFELVVKLDGTEKKLGCKPLELLDIRDFAKFSREIDKDFLARPMKAEGLLPGAFQNFIAGINTQTVWPVSFERPSMPAKVIPQPRPGAPGLQPVPPKAKK